MGTLSSTLPLLKLPSFDWRNIRFPEEFSEPQVLRFWIPAGFSVLVLLLGALGLGSYHSVQRVVDESTSVRHSTEVIGEIHATYGSIATAESEQRGFVLTGKQVFLDGYRRSVDEADKKVTHLQVLLAGEPKQKELARQVGELVKDRIYRMEVVVQAAQSNGTEGAIQLIGPGEQVMEQIRRLRDRMVHAEEDLLVEKRENRDEAVRQTTAAFASTALITLSLLATLFWIFSRFLHTQYEARRASEAHRTELQFQIEEKERAELELQRSNRELQDFAFVASHDLQEPLRKIQAFGDRLKTKNENVLDETSKDYLVRMLNAAGRMQELINALLDLSRITTKAQPFSSVDLNETLSVVGEDLERRLQDTEGEVDIHPLPRIQGDPVQMRQLFQNLVGNALKFRHPERTPVVGVRQVLSPRPDFVRILVEDNGIGFDPRHAEKIFTVFQRLHGRSEYEGSGIGLAICRRIVDRHGGRIVADSVPGEGSRFTIDLPKMHQEGKP